MHFALLGEEIIAGRGEIIAGEGNHRGWGGGWEGNYWEEGKSSRGGGGGEGIIRGGKSNRGGGGGGREGEGNHRGGGGGSLVDGDHWWMEIIGGRESIHFYIGF